MNYLKILNEDDNGVNEAAPGLGSGTSILPKEVEQQLKYDARDAVRFLKEMKTHVGSTLGQLENATRIIDKKGQAFSIADGEDYIDGMISALEKFVQNPQDKKAASDFMKFYAKANDKGSALYAAQNLAKFIKAMNPKALEVYGQWLSTGSGNTLFGLMSGMHAM